MFEMPNGKKEILNKNTTTLDEENSAFKQINKQNTKKKNKKNI